MTSIARVGRVGEHSRKDVRVGVGVVVFQLYRAVRADKQTDRQTDIHITILRTVEVEKLL